MWQKLIIVASPNDSEKITDILEELGALAITFEADDAEEIFEPELGTTPLWQKTRVIALFDQNSDIQQVISNVKQILFPHTITNFSIESIAEQDWQRVCTDAFKPVCIANKLWICPSWHDLPDDDKAIVALDPGLAFGTGAHPTTALCLNWLAEKITQGQQVIDYGSGSGILAIAALKLGAKECWAVDNDPQALESTLENARRNHIAEQQLQAVLPEDLPQLQTDILIANILANPLIELAPKLGKLIKPGGKIALSGILHYQIKQVMEAYKPLFTFNVPEIKDEWALLSGRKMGKGR